MHVKCSTHLIVFELVIEIFKKYTETPLYVVFASLLLVPILALYSNLLCHTVPLGRERSHP
jgi:hypothetical protein